MAEEAPDNLEPTDAYALLSKPTLDLTDAEVEKVVADLRRRRALYAATGKPDRQPKPKAEPKGKSTAADKAANTAALLASLQLKI
jgi:hypothetical protein